MEEGDRTLRGEAEGDVGRTAKREMVALSERPGAVAPQVKTRILPPVLLLRGGGFEGERG